MNTIIKNILSRWYYFALVFIGCFVISFYSLYLIDRPLDYEKISIFLSSYTQNTKDFREKINNESPTYLRKIDFYSYQSNDPYFNLVFEGQGLTSDIIVIPESRISTSTVTSCFALLDTEYVTQFLGNVHYYKIEQLNHNYGILIHKHGSKTESLLNYYDDKDIDENYYMFFLKNSVHIGKINNTSWTTAFMFAKVFLQYGS